MTDDLPPERQRQFGRYGVAVGIGLLVGAASSVPAGWSAGDAGTLAIMGLLSLGFGVLLLDAAKRGVRADSGGEPDVE